MGGGAAKALTELLLPPSFSTTVAGLGAPSCHHTHAKWQKKSSVNTSRDPPSRRIAGKLGNTTVEKLGKEGTGWCCWRAVADWT